MINMITLRRELEQARSDYSDLVARDVALRKERESCQDKIGFLRQELTTTSDADKKYSVKHSIQKDEDRLAQIELELGDIKLKYKEFEKRIFELETQINQAAPYDYLVNINSIVDEQESNTLLDPESAEFLPCLEPEIDKLTNREAEIQVFASVLRAIRNQSTFRMKRILEWTGGPGLGKSQLRRLLVRECEWQNIPVAMLNFDNLTQVEAGNHSEEDLIVDPTKLFKFLIEQLTVTLEKHEEMNEAIECFQDCEQPENIIQAYFHLTRADLLYCRPDWVKCLDDVLNAFVAVVKNLSQGETTTTLRPIVFFFDETEEANFQLVDWLEEWLIAPLLQKTKSTLVIWLARRPWTWKQPETRNHLSSMELGPFNLEESRKQLEVQSPDPDLAYEFFHKAQQFTYGHPSANFVVAGYTRLLAGQEEELLTIPNEGIK